MGETHVRQEPARRDVAVSQLSQTTYSYVLIYNYSANVNVEGSPDRVDQSKLEQIPPNQDLSPAPIDGSVDKWFFISGAAV